MHSLSIDIIRLEILFSSSRKMEDRSTHDDLYSLDDRHQNDKLNWKLYEDVTKKHKEGMRETACMNTF